MTLKKPIVTNEPDDTGTRTRIEPSAKFATIHRDSLWVDDSHCHISRDFTDLQINNLCSQLIELDHNGCLAIMSTSDFDRPIINKLATSLNNHTIDDIPCIVPGFGMLFFRLNSHLAHILMT